MREFSKIKRILFYLIVVGLLVWASSINQQIQKNAIVVSKQNDAWNLNNQLILSYNLGYKRLISSIIWINTILDSDLEHYKNHDYNSWMFIRFNTISDLEPKFYENYSFGGVYLSVIKDDLEGATTIFNKGLRIYPRDYNLLKDANYHFVFEVKNYSRAYEITQTLKKYYPQKLAITSLVSRLEAENNKLDNALETLNGLQKLYPVGNFIGDRLFNNRYSLKAEIDLGCLNSQKNHLCSQYDLKNQPYLKTKNCYMAQSKWKPFRAQKK